MKLRLFPIVLFAATSLLTLKAFDMVFNGEALFEGTTARAEEKKTEEKKAEEKPAAAEAKSSEDAAKRSLLDATPVERPKENITLPKGEESAETALNERLGEKRRELEDRIKELDLRETLLKTAEKKLEDRANELKQLEASLTDQTKTKNAQGNMEIKSLVMMYETMKPAAAAAIFDKLDMKVMLEVSSRMKPQLTAAILAKMSPQNAEKLTVELARRSLQPETPMQLSAPGGPPAAQTFGNAKELPRIDNPPPKAN